MGSQVIVVGGGLAGLSAAHTVIERGGNVVVLEKNPFLGGNSTKATSGMNGALTKTQIKLGIPDTVDIFYEDSARSARDLIVPSLTKVLTYDSASAVEWVNEKFGVDLSLVSRLGGHSQPRTHRGKEKFPGMTITYALMEKLEDLAIAHPKNVRIIKKARVTRLLQGADGKEVVGCEFEVNGQLMQEMGPVVLATGGYAADFTPDSLLKKYRPDIYDLPTTNGDHSTGDGIKMALALGANTIHMEKVQVHPTGLVDPQEPDAKVKFLAAEALRGVGGLLINADGKRFCDELGHRDYVTGEIWKTKGPVRLVLNGAGGREIEWHVKHYKGRGLMKQFMSGAELAKEIGCPLSNLEETFKAYNEIAEKKNDPYGKKFFHNVPFKSQDEFWVAHITPVLHFTMGGLEIDDQCLVKGGQEAIPGLFACGELGGGVHGANRLGGSSLLGCVVFGRVAGNTASRYLFSRLSTSQVAAARVGQIGSQLGQGMKLNLVPSQNGLQLEITWGGEGGFSIPSAAPAAASAPAAAAPEPAKQDRSKVYTYADVAKHNSEGDCWVVVNGEVLNATPFLSEHPGGKKAIMIYAGKDATEEFNMMHKPDVVEKYAPHIIIGKIDPASKK